MKRSVFSNDKTRTNNTNSSMLRCFGTDPTFFRTAAALRWWGPEVDFFCGSSFDRH